MYYFLLCIMFWTASHKIFFHAHLETASFMSCMYVLDFLFHLNAIQLFHFINIVKSKR